MIRGRQFFTALHQLKYMSHKLKPKCKLSEGEFFMLKSIEYFTKNEKSGGVMPSDLSSCMHISKPAISKMLNTMEDENYITRTSDKKDRRVIYIHLTEEGKSAVVSVEEKMYEYADHLMERLGDEDSVKLMAIFERIFAIMREDFPLTAKDHDDFWKKRD